MNVVYESKSNSGSKKDCIAMIENLGEWIRDNAELIIGDCENGRKIHYNFKMEISEKPMLKVEKIRG